MLKGFIALFIFLSLSGVQCGNYLFKGKSKGKREFPLLSCARANAFRFFVDGVSYKLFVGKTILDTETKTRSSNQPLHFEQLQKSLPIVMIIPGSYNLEYYEKFMKYFLKAYRNGDYNLIFVDWVPAGGDPVGTAKEASASGHNLARAIIDLLNEGNKIDRIITHGVGAVVAGRAGKLIPNKIRRIVGLDPPLIMLEIPEISRLDTNSAALVEVVHTSIGGKGIPNRIGHRDFYPNSGTQPMKGCEIEDPQCDTDKSFEYYTQAFLTPLNFIATLCPSWFSYIQNACRNYPRLLLNNIVPQGVVRDGNYYLKTN